ncbi:hypothetical protein MMC12_004192 [Toensbergia leucococca]|nr:hypothetical protein [Toensbergia leucococca]
MSNITLTPERVSPAIKHIRRELPYLAYAARPDRNLPELGLRQTDPQIILPAKSPTRWLTSQGSGSRHIHDVAPFDMWDNEEQRYKHSTSEIVDWICTTYSATRLLFGFSCMILGTLTPPNPMPLTVGGMAAKFLPPDTECPESLLGNTNYGFHRLPDPYPLQLNGSESTTGQKCEIIHALRQVCNLEAMIFSSVVNVAILVGGDGRQYTTQSLPGKVGGAATVYYHGSESYWSHMEQRALERLRKPDQGAVDDTGYLDRQGYINPGVKVDGLTASTSAGLLLRNITTQQRRLTVANHAFLDTNEVWHPDGNASLLGTIDERYEAEDLALVKLKNHVAFRNTEYFDGTVPRRLLRSTEIPLANMSQWFCCDGFSTGLVSLRAIGTMWHVPSRGRGSDDPLGRIQYAEFVREIVFENTGPTGEVAGDGLCGAPIVWDDGDHGGVAGFYQVGNSTYSLCAVLDKLMDAGWSL